MALEQNTSASGDTATRAYPDLNLYIDGQWLAAAGRDTTAVLDPASGQIIGKLPCASTEDLNQALAAAQRAQPHWAALPAFERAKILTRAADLIRERLEFIAQVMTYEQGKPLREARIEVAFAADVFTWMAEEGRRAYGRVIPARHADWRWTALQQPVGVVAAFSPWNFPATSPARKLAGPLAAGCCCILKAAEETPATAIELTRALQDAGLPTGVVNLVFGDPDAISRQLISSPVIRKITFTGSTAVGNHLASLASAAGKPATLELGGHAPVLVFDDVNVAATAEMAVASKFRNAGQVCTSPSRIFVQRRVHDAFLEHFVSHTTRLHMGPGHLDSTTMGPLANARRVHAMRELMQDALESGATCHLGGTAANGAGNFWPATVLSSISPDARLLHQEPFGPVAAILPFDDESEVINRANALPYGLASYLFTRDTDRCLRVSNALQTGLVGINTFVLNGPETPWGGVRDSGYGREGGIEGLASYTTTKFVSQGPAR